MYYAYYWYWLADDSRLFSSKKQALVQPDDPDYVTFLQLNVASAWPRDDAGNQTDAALQAVLAPYGMFVNLTYYAADARFRRASGGMFETSMSPAAFLTDPVSRNSVNSAWNYSTQKGVGYTVQWKMSDGSFIVLDGAQLTMLSNDMSSFVESCFACEADTASKIDGGTITTRAQVDAAFAAVSNVFP